MNRIKNIKILFIGLLLAFLITPLFTITSSATVGTSKVDPITGAITDTTNTTKSDIEDAVGIPNVTIDDAKDLVEKKTYDVVSLLQVFAKPFTIICFIISAIVTVMGAFGRGGYVSKGILGMFISGLVYTAVMYAPQIVQFFSTWLIN